MYRTLLKNRNYTKLLSANMINRLGDGIDSIAFTWLTYALTKNASLSAIVFAANVLPTVLFQPLAAPFVDRMQKQKVMVWSDLLRGLSLSGFLLLFSDRFSTAMDVCCIYLSLLIVSRHFAFPPEFLICQKCLPTKSLTRASTSIRSVLRSVWSQELLQEEFLWP